MFGKTEIFLYAVVILSVAAMATDLLWGRIYNWLTFPALIAGLALSFWLGGWTLGLNSLYGVVAALLLYGWMFALGWMGGGDVKFLMALGAWGGLYFAESVAILGVLLGGVMSILILTFKGRIIDFSKRMYHFFLTLSSKDLEPELKVDKTLTMPFGIPIAIAAVWVAFLNPMQHWGVRLWP